MCASPTDLNSANTPLPPPPPPPNPDTPSLITPYAKQTLERRYSTPDLSLPKRLIKRKPYDSPPPASVPRGTTEITHQEKINKEAIEEQECLLRLSNLREVHRQMISTSSSVSHQEADPSPTIEKSPEAEKLVEFILTHPTERTVALLSSPWFVTPDLFFASLLQHLFNSQDPKQQLILLESIQELVTSLFSHPLTKTTKLELCHIHEIIKDSFSKKKNWKHVLEPLKVSIDGFLIKNFSSSRQRMKPLPSPQKTRQPSQQRAMSKIFHTHYFDILAQEVTADQVSTETIENLARGLQSIEIHFFSHIHPQEFAKLKWRQNPEGTPYIQIYLRYTNTLSCLVISHIIEAKTPKLRAYWCEFYIKLAYQTMKMESLNTAYTLVQALRSSTIDRLQATWEEVDKVALQAKKELKHLFSEEGNYKGYRDHIREWQSKVKLQQAPCDLIPLLKRYLDLFSKVEENNADVLESGHLNHHKINLLDEYYREIRNYQQSLRTAHDPRVIKRCYRSLFKLLQNTAQNLSETIFKRAGTEVPKFNEDFKAWEKAMQDVSRNSR